MWKYEETGVKHFSLQLRFVAGSHKWGWFYPRKFATLKNYPMKDGENEDKNTYTNVPSDEHLENGQVWFEKRRRFKLNFEYWLFT